MLLSSVALDESWSRFQAIIEGTVAQIPVHKRPYISSPSQTLTRRSKSPICRKYRSGKKGIKDLKHR